MTKAQRLHAKQGRALLQLRRTAVRWSVVSDAEHVGDDDGDALINALGDMQIAADKYTDTLSPRERRKLIK